jgi:hypothetical protein
LGAHSSPPPSEAQWPIFKKSIAVNDYLNNGVDLYSALQVPVKPFLPVFGRVRSGASSMPAFVTKGLRFGVF